MRMYTVEDIARELGWNKNSVRKKIRAFLKYNGIPPSRVTRKLNKYGSGYALDEELYDEFMHFIQPKIRIEVKMQ